MEAALATHAQGFLSPGAVAELEARNAVRGRVVAEALGHHQQRLSRAHQPDLDKRGTGEEEECTVK